jgi:hypothetical protein
VHSGRSDGEISIFDAEPPGGKSAAVHFVLVVRGE